MDYVNQVERMIDREKVYAGAKREGEEAVMVCGSLLVLAGRSYTPYHFPDIILQIVGGELRSYRCAVEIDPAFPMETDFPSASGEKRALRYSAPGLSIIAKTLRYHTY